jgi:hypothetical protein
MNESDLGEEPVIHIGKVTAVAEIERVIAHLEADVAFHRTQTKMFEKLLNTEQKNLAQLHDECSHGTGEVNGA